MGFLEIVCLLQWAGSPGMSTASGVGFICGIAAFVNSEWVCSGKQVQQLSPIGRRIP